MIDELTLERALTELANEIPVPADGVERILDDVDTEPTSAPRSSAPRLPKVLAVAAAVVIVAGVGLALRGHNTTSSKSARTAAPGFAAYGDDTVSNAGAGGGAVGSPVVAHGAAGTSPQPTPPAQTAAAPDSAKIVKTGTVDLQAARADLRVTVDRVTGVAVGLGGYVANSNTDFEATEATAQVTVRVPVASFETATGRLHNLAGVIVLGDSENGVDVTAQYTDLQAQLTAATGERNQLLVVLSRAQTIGDILAVHDRIQAVQTQVDQLQGKIKVLNDQASFSSLAVTISQKPAAAAAHHAAPTGISKAWADARQGFADVTEWMIARSGGALVVLVTLLALLFGLRYLFPVVRRALI